jgi:hypothetical protein
MYNGKLTTAWKVIKMHILEDWRRLTETDFPKSGGITEETRERTIREANRYRGSVRVSTGRFPTDAEYEKRRKKVLSKKLP